MIFVKSNELKKGMRLARPIYNSSGTLLYERNSKLTEQSISSIKNFNLIGLFILEPAEPVPPMTEEDIEFERFQTMQVFAIEEEMKRISESHKTQKIENIVGSITKSYGHLNHKINFIQGLRSKEDYLYKHSLNVAILCAMIGHVLNISPKEQQNVVRAAVLHDIGQLHLPDDLIGVSDLDEKGRMILDSVQGEGYKLLDATYTSDATVRRICQQAFRRQRDFEDGQKSEAKMTTEAKILLVAQIYDQMTAMQYGREPDSEVAAIRHLMEHTDVYDEKVVQALIQSINILMPGVSVELSTGAKALVITANESNLLKPVVLTFRDNSIIDLDNRNNSDIQIKDIMKTMDNRYIIDTETLKKHGFQVEEPNYVEVPPSQEDKEKAGQEKADRQ